MGLVSGLVEWIFAPANEKEEEVQLVKPYEGKIIKPFRPQTLAEYVGQERAKSVITSYIEGTRKHNRPFPHILTHGFAGCGKTTLIRLLANELGVPFVDVVTSELETSFQLYLKIASVNGGVVFLDEVHSLPRGLAESLYAIMEDFTYNGQPIAPFTLAGATTELGEILKTRKPFHDRFKIITELDPYTPNELAIIAKQYHQHTFPKVQLDDKVYEVLGKNSRGTPRTIIRLLESTIYLEGDYKKALDNADIILDGFTTKDRKVLDFIMDYEKGVGLQAISSYLNTSQENYLQQIEPYLLQSGAILRTPRGRKITGTGEGLLIKLKGVIPNGKI